MKVSERAKIFGAFNPLKNLGQALAQKEKVIVPKAELADDRMEEIDRAMRKISVGCMVEVVFYNGCEYQRLVGCVSSFSPQNKTLSVIKTQISFENIYDLRLERE